MGAAEDDGKSGNAKVETAAEFRVTGRLRRRLSHPMEIDRLLNIADYARAARGRLAREAFDYYEGGALDEITLRENTEGWSTAFTA